MKKFTLSIVAFAVLSALAMADVPLKVPETVKGKTGTYITVKAETTGKVVRWKLLDEGISLFPVELLKDTKVAVLTTDKKAKFRLLAVTALGDEPSEPQIVVIDTTDGITPPPDIPPVVPVSDLGKKLQSAYAAGVKDQASLTQLAALYGQAAENDFLTKVVSWEHLFQSMDSSAKSLGLKGKLLPLQGIISDYLKKAGFSSSDDKTALTDSSRTKISVAFKAVSEALSQVK